MDYIIQFITQNIEILYILVFAVFLGMEVISKVPTVLHTPLMSGANGISGVVVVGVGLCAADVDEVILGQVLTAGTGQNPARQTRSLPYRRSPNA